MGVGVDDGLTGGRYINMELGFWFGPGGFKCWIRLWNWIIKGSFGFVTLKYHKDQSCN